MRSLIGKMGDLQRFETLGWILHIKAVAYIYRFVILLKIIGLKVLQIWVSDTLYNLPQRWCWGITCENVKMPCAAWQPVLQYFCYSVFFVITFMKIDPPIRDYLHRLLKLQNQQISRVPLMTTNYAFKLLAMRRLPYSEETRNV